MTEQELKQKYEEDRDYFEWMGVGRSEYVNDCLRGQLLDMLAAISDDAMWEAWAYDQQMHHKYDGPQPFYDEYLKGLANGERPDPFPSPSFLKAEEYLGNMPTLIEYLNDHRIKPTEN